MTQASKSPASRDLDLSVSMRDPSIPLPAAEEMIFRQLNLYAFKWARRRSIGVNQGPARGEGSELKGAMFGSGVK